MSIIILLIPHGPKAKLKFEVYYNYLINVLKYKIEWVSSFNNGLAKSMFFFLISNEPQIKNRIFKTLQLLKRNLKHEMNWSFN